MLEILCHSSNIQSKRNDICLEPFDFDKALKALQSGQALTGKDGILTPLIKQLTEATLSAELDSHLAQDVNANRKNGSGNKTIKSLYPTSRESCGSLRKRTHHFATDESSVSGLVRQSMSRAATFTCSRATAEVRVLASA